MLHHGIAIAAPSSGAGKTTLTLALLHALNERFPVQPFKIGPDYIDPRFHEAVTGVPSVNLDPFLMSAPQMRALFSRYAEGRMAVLEGVMGFYDGLDRTTSTFDVTLSLGIPVLLVLPAGGMSHTLLALLKGLLEYRKNHTIAGVVLNHLSGESHYRLLQGLIRTEFPDLAIAGWIEKGIPGIGERHLGLSTAELDRDRLTELTGRVLEHVEMDLVHSLLSRPIPVEEQWEESFPPLPPDIRSRMGRSHIAIVRDGAFSFTYTDNLRYLESLFGRVTYVSAMENRPIPGDADLVYLPGGYVETPEVSPSLQRADLFRESLCRHAGAGKRIYAECAGLMYLGREVVLTDGVHLPMSGILPIAFQMGKKRRRLGYYMAQSRGVNRKHSQKELYRGHAFHYSDAIPDPAFGAIWDLSKPEGETGVSGVRGMENENAGENRKESEKEAAGGRGEPGAWRSGRVVGTYLHTMFRNNNELMEKYFI